MKTCYKRGYRSKVLAKRHARKARMNGFGSNIYRCPKCGDWHLTKMPRRPPRRLEP